MKERKKDLIIDKQIENVNYLMGYLNIDLHCFTYGGLMNGSLMCSCKRSLKLLDYYICKEEETTIIFKLRPVKHQKLKT